MLWCHYLRVYFLAQTPPLFLLVRSGVWAQDYAVDVHVIYLGCFLKLVACEIESMEMCECGEVGEGGELVGVE